MFRGVVFCFFHKKAHLTQKLIKDKCFRLQCKYTINTKLINQAFKLTFWPHLPLTFGEISLLFELPLTKMDTVNRGVTKVKSVGSTFLSPRGAKVLYVHLVFIDLYILTTFTTHFVEILMLF